VGKAAKPHLSPKPAIDAYGGNSISKYLLLADVSLCALCSDSFFFFQEFWLERL
jgi:hypothetical protein